MQRLQQSFPFLNNQYSTEHFNYLGGLIHNRIIVVSVESTDEVCQWILSDNNKYLVVAADVNTKIPDEITTALARILNNEQVESNQGAKILQILLG